MDGSDVIDSVSDFQIITQSQNGNANQGLQTFINFEGSDNPTPIFLTEIDPPTQGISLSVENASVEGTYSLINDDAQVLLGEGDYTGLATFRQVHMMLMMME